MTSLPKPVHRRVKHVCHGRQLLAILSMLSLALILLRTEVAIEYVTQGLLLCARSVIPSLFPFMVLSEVIVTGRLLDRPLGWLLRPLGRLLRLPAAGCTATVLGLLCGFPVGAKCAVLAYREGLLSREEAERTVAIANAPSSAFLISAVGVTLWGNRSFGAALYGSVLTSALTVGIFLGRLSKSEGRDAKNATRPLPAPRIGARLFTNAIASATGSILTVCAYVIFFSALMGTLSSMLDKGQTFGVGIASLFAVFELSGGVCRISALGNTLRAAVLTALAVGWSGISVHCQVQSICGDEGLSLRPYLIARVLVALLTALLFGILITRCPELTLPATVCGH